MLTSFPPPKQRKVLEEFDSQFESKVEVVGAVRLLRFVPPMTCDDATINQFIAESDWKLEGLPMQKSKTYLARPRVSGDQWMIQRLLVMIARVMMMVRACDGGEHLRVLQFIEELTLDQETCWSK